MGRLRSISTAEFKMARMGRVGMWRGGGRLGMSVSAPHMGVIRSRGFVPSFSPFVSDPKSEPSVIRSGFRCSYQPHIRSPLVGGRTNIPLTGGQGLKRTRPIFRSAFQGQRGGAVVHLDLLGLINPSRLQN